MLAHAPPYDEAQRQRRVLQHRAGALGAPRGLVAAVLVFFEGRGVEIGPQLVQQGALARLFDVFADRPGQPEQVVRAARAHAAVRLALVPPVHDVALLVLVGAGGEDALPRRGGGDGQEVHRVLQLVAEAVGPAALVDGSARQQAAGQGLVDGPAVHIAVELRMGRLDLQPARERGPAALRFIEQREGALRLRKAVQLR